ncbi:MAG: TlpA family protein disulfide reductase [Candidatus Latescibacteria bacterium]|nr:TlpA family protein disulfide reductase [Candidatus Latescibacterota bacterium]
MKLYLSIFVALFSTASVGLAQQAPRAATITGKIYNPPAQEIEFGYQSSLSPTRSEHLVVLDSENRFALTFPVPRGTLVMGRYKDPQPPKWRWLAGLRSFVFGPRAQLILFVEPGDSLHIEMNEGRFSSSLEFSGQGADNNRFIAEILPDYLAFRLDYEGLALEDFIRQVEQRRQDEFEWLAKGREKYALSPGFIDYATARFNYEWARQMISYPMNYRFANDHDNRDITSEYYDFLQDIPLVDEKAMGVSEYRSFLKRTLNWELDKVALQKLRNPTLSEMYDFSGLELSKVAQIHLDSLYEEEGQRPGLSKMVDLSALDLSGSDQAHLDSLYENRRSLRLSERVDLSKFELSEAAIAQIDSFYERSGKSYGITKSSGYESSRIDTMGTKVVFHLPMEEELEGASEQVPLSEQLDWSELSLSAAQSRLDSLYEHRQPLKLSEKLDLSELGLSEAAQAQLDSIYAAPRVFKSSFFSEEWNALIKEKLDGKVLYWFLAGELIDGFERGHEVSAWVHEKWEEFKETNPYPEYNEAIEAALAKALVLQPGQPAPDFTLDDLDGQPVSLNQFKGKAIFIDFWASWCGPCIGDLPYIQKIKAEMAEQPVVFLNISLDDDEEAWRKAVAKHEIKGVHLRAAGWSADVAKAYSIRSLPSYYVVDARGRIAERLRAVHDTQEIVAKLAESTKAAGG